MNKLKELLLAQRTPEGQTLDVFYCMEDTVPDVFDLSRRTLAYLNSQTFGRIVQIEDEETLSLSAEVWVELTKALAQHRKDDRGSITSESIDGWNRSFASKESRQAGLDADMKRIVRDYLGETGLLYRGTEEW